MCVMRRNKRLWETECGCWEIVDKNLKSDGGCAVIVPDREGRGLMGNCALWR